MRIAIHDADAEHFGTHNKFPNYALMKISTYHKARGDTVEWFMPLDRYDKIYSSKVFDFTEENPYLPPDTIKGGTGYGIFEDLPNEIDRCFPDYSLYPECDYAIGFLTRGCPNKCSHCYVPQKEGDIKPYRTWQEVVRPDTNKLTLMDNNILAHSHGIEQLRQLAQTDYRLDINQAMSVFLVTPETADILARCKWQKYIRFAVDRKAQIEGAYRAAELLAERGIPNSKLFFYCLLTDDLEDDLTRIYAMRKLKSCTLYGMPYKAERTFSATGRPVLDIEEYVADHLLANGVIVQAHGHWIEQSDGWDGVLYTCSACHCDWCTIDGTPMERSNENAE